MKGQKLITDLNDYIRRATLKSNLVRMGLRWINYSDHQNAVISFIRKGNKVKDDVFVVCNFTGNS
jgi:1,4-alpha-glucan branching enzyme